MERVHRFSGWPGDDPGTQSHPENLMEVPCSRSVPASSRSSGKLFRRSCPDTTTATPSAVTGRAS